MDKEEQISKLTLLLLYLTSWRERDSTYRSWKGYDFDTLDKLEENGLITKSNSSKSIQLTEPGLEEARRIEEKFEQLKI